MAKKITKSSGRKISPEVAKFIEERMNLFSKEFVDTTDEKIEKRCVSIQSDMESLFIGLANNILRGKMDARSIANSVARSIAPQLRDLINESLSQRGGNLLDIITKAQRNM